MVNARVAIRMYNTTRVIHSALRTASSVVPTRIDRKEGELGALATGGGPFGRIAADPSNKLATVVSVVKCRIAEDCASTLFWKAAFPVKTSR